jgi:long-chain fatty acid transport protein
MGNAYIGVADDLSAVWYNPAGLTQLIGGKKNIQQFGVSLVTLGITVDEPVASPQSGTSHYSAKMPSNIPFLRTLGGLALTDWCYLAPFPNLITFAGYSEFSDTQTDIRFNGYVVSNFTLDLIPSIAFKIHKMLSVGFGLNINMFNQFKQQNILGDGYLLGSAADLISQMTGTHVDPKVLTGNPALSFLLDGKDDGKLLVRTDKEFPTGIKPVNDVDINFRDVGFNVGILTKPLDWLRIGVKYRSEIRDHIEGDIALVVNPFDPLVQLTQNTPLAITDDTKRFKMTFALPQQIGLGIAIQPLDWFLWSVDYTWTDWHHARKSDDLFVGGGGLGPTHVTMFSVPRHYNSVSSVRTGLEFKLAPNFFVEGGFWYDPSPCPDEEWDISSGLNDYYIYSLGAGYKGLFNGRVDINTHFQYVTTNKRYIGVGEGKHLGGTKAAGDPLVGGVPNEDFSMVIDGQVVNWGLDFTIHF